MVAQTNFLSSDRPDISYAVKELCRSMSKPSSKDMDSLKRLARYLKGRPRMVIHFGLQAAPGELTVLTDSEWAGCVSAQKSTSGGVVM
eukprot:11065978-Heterocapsa_arctica.AAC.1